MFGLAMAVAVTVVTAVSVGGDSTTSDLRELGPGGYLLVALGGAALIFRNTAPVMTFAVTLGLGIVYQAVSYQGGPDPLPIVVALYTIAALGGRQRALGFGLLATIVLVAVRSVSTDGFNSPLVIVFPTAVVGALYMGMMVASRRTERLEAAERAEQAERLREQETKRRVDAERLRIARELHDVVAHNISLISVQATVGVHLIDERPAEAAAALAAIKQASKQALRELRRILDVLRQADEAEPTAPAPGLAELDALIISTRHAGLPTELQVRGQRRPLPSTVDVAAFRIIQESLTNALRYASPAETRVTLDYEEGVLNLEVTDDGAAAATALGSGHGIAGMRERAAAVGGSLHAEPLVGGGFSVRATLPVSDAPT